MAKASGGPKFNVDAGPISGGIEWHSERLQARFPDPNDLSLADNLLDWGKTEGQRSLPELERYFSSRTVIAKNLPGQHTALSRDEVSTLPRATHPDVNRIVEPDWQAREQQADLRRRMEIFRHGVKSNPLYQLFRRVGLRAKLLIWTEA